MNADKFINICQVSGDALIEALRYKPLGWNQTFDASRGEIGDKKAGGRSAI